MTAKGQSTGISLSVNAATQPRSHAVPFTFFKCNEHRFLKVINYKYIFYIIYYNNIIIYNIDNGTRHTAKLKSQDGTAWLRGSVAATETYTCNIHCIYLYISIASLSLYV